MVPVTDDAATDVTPVWSPDGRYLYFLSDRSGSMNLWRVAIDEKSGSLQAEPEPVTNGVSGSAREPSLSADGRQIVYAAGDATSNIQKVSFKPAAGVVEGSPVWITRGTTASMWPNPSPDGEWLAFGSIGKQEDLSLIRTDGTGRRKLTDDIHKDRLPRWSPDGARIVFYSDRGGSWQIWTIRPDGSGLQQITQGAMITWPVWSPDGTSLAYLENREMNTQILDMRKPWSQQTPEPLPRLSGTGESCQENSWAPDGKRLAGHSENAAGKSTGICVYDLGTRKMERLTSSGTYPIWLQDSRRVLFVQKDQIILLDTLTGRIRPILSVAPDAIDICALSRDNRTIYLARAAVEADLWMLTLRH